jgi:hypothetical protein
VPSNPDPGSSADASDHAGHILDHAPRCLEPRAVPGQDNFQLAHSRGHIPGLPSLTPPRGQEGVLPGITSAMPLRFSLGTVGGARVMLKPGAQSCLGRHARFDLSFDLHNGLAADDLEVVVSLHVQPVLGGKSEVACQTQ